ncbi:unnamed protein product [Amoebophrya sp. A120]|nr:unnamed protein product [Amoebophrya sp. A120]|eukprot:GSA120T00006671001.1
MLYKSTRGGEQDVSFLQAVLRGLSADGGLFVPQMNLPATIDKDFVLEKWGHLSYAQLAFKVLRLFIGEDEFDDATLKDLCDRSYGGVRWRSGSEIVQREALDHITLLELFHGPTFAFKDCALQFLGNLFEVALAKRTHAAGAKKAAKSAVILGATSGDTGSAALAGVSGKQGVSGVVLYPQNRVSYIQELQMLSFNTIQTGATDDGKNAGAPPVAQNVVHACSVQDATFDDCQAIVKAIFQQKDFVEQNNVLAVNSINIARVLCQMVYYLYCYFRHNEKILEQRRNLGANLARTNLRLPKMRFSVPTGNFGDILAGYYCQKFFRLDDIFELVIASNENDILTRFFETGAYTPAKSVKATLSPSMDIQVSSNFERFLLDVAGGDCAKVAAWFADLKNKKSFEVSPVELQQARKYFTAWCVDETETLETIADVHADFGYLLCPHTAVGYKAMLKDLQHRGGDIQPVVLATAHYGKFVGTMSPKIVAGSDKITEPEKLKAALKTQMPRELAELETRDKALLQKTIPLRKDTNLVQQYVTDVVNRGILMNAPLATRAGAEDKFSMDSTYNDPTKTLLGKLNAIATAVCGPVCCK